jgi:hypothetical protein
MSELTALKDRTWPAEQVLTMACAIFRTRGFTSASTFIAADADSDLRWNSKEHLSYQMIPDLDKEYKVLINITQEDIDTAKAIVHHYRKLTFGVIADNLSDYMQMVFTNTQKPEVKFKDFGVLASVPSAYHKEIDRKRIEKEAKDAKQEHLGEVGKTIELNIRYINIRFVQKLNCYAHDAITETGHLVNFLNKSELGKIGSTQKVRAKVKSHGINYTTKSIETQLNYVKTIDNDLVWQ